MSYSPKKSFFHKIRKAKLLYVMFFPILFYFIVFKYLPLYGLYIVFTKFSPFLGVFDSPWIGLDNFSRLFSSSDFAQIVINTLLLAGYGLLFGFPIPIIFALLLNEVKFSFFKRFVQSVSFFPFFISSAVAVALMYIMFASDGPVNQILQYLFGAKTHYFMAEADYFRSLYTGLNIWKGFGYSAIVYLAAIAGIDPHLYEAADVDGANRWRKIWHITLPGISNTIVILLILALASILSTDLETVLLMYNDNIASRAETLQIFVYHKAFPEDAIPDFSFAAAVGIFQSVVALVLIVLSNHAAKRLSESRLF